MYFLAVAVRCLLPFVTLCKHSAAPGAYFRARCLARRFMKQQVTAAMMTMPTNKAEDTPMINGMRSRSATGEGIQRGKVKVLETGGVVICAFTSLYFTFGTQQYPRTTSQNLKCCNILPAGLLFPNHMVVAKDDGALQHPVLFLSNGRVCQQHRIFMNNLTT